MALKTLEALASKTPYETLPANWNSFELERFSSDKQLWDYQQVALTRAVVALFKYYEDFVDYEPGEDPRADRQRKEKLEEWYAHGCPLSSQERKSLNLNLKKTKLPLREMIDPFFPLDEDAPMIDFKAICNRMSFWMATGAGKTIVLVKLLELLHLLMRRYEIPERDVLFLTHREDLIEQFQETVREFNQCPDSPVHIELKELREYPEAKREAPGGLLGRDATLRVFYYRSDNLSDEHKDLIVNFRNYDNEGKWYVLLDEAHKGDSADSKRKHIFNIMSRAGFLFNFSATFTDPVDLISTVHNFNLSQFIDEGYGKHVTVLKQELAAFQRDQTDYSDEEKRKIVAKSMLLLAFTANKVRALRETSGNAKLYHHPMLLALVNSVNTDDADLKLYFEQIISIARGKVPKKIWNEAKRELWAELKEQPPFLYEEGPYGKPRVLTIAKEDIDPLSVEDVWREVYNFESTKGGDLEVLVRPGNKKEIAFKMKASDKPFALIKIGDVTDWLKEHLSGFDYVETFETESFFKGLNAPESSINILMGSRSFYEGWDSHRPNVINFVNIGVGDTAKKFIMQSVGRGVRVRSWGGARRRFEMLYDDFVDSKLFKKLRGETVFPETLYVLGTNREALNTVLGKLKEEKPDLQELLMLELNPESEKHPLLVPRYVKGGTPIVDLRNPTKFEITEEDFEISSQYVTSVADDRVLLLAHGGSPKQVARFRDGIQKSDTYYSKHGNRSFRNMDVLVGKVMTYFDLKAKELETFSAVEIGKDIIHFQKMSVDKVHAADLQRRLDRVLYSQTPAGKQEAGDAWKEVEQLELDYSEKAQEMARVMDERQLGSKQTFNDEICVEYLANHLYLPMIYSLGKRLDYIRHIIDEESERHFLEDLKKSVAKKDCALRDLDWWMFSRLDQYLDQPNIPYYDPKQNKVRAFIPDFIFWGAKGKDYTILFVDPKGMQHEDWRNKVAGFKRLFEDKGKPMQFPQKDFTLTVRLAMFNRRRDRSSEGDDSRYWHDNPSSIFSEVFC